MLAHGAAGVLGSGTALARTAVAFTCFCLAASGTYFLNDALDVEADRRHPVKQNRPIASGEVSVRTAIIGGILVFHDAIGSGAPETTARFLAFCLVIAGAALMPAPMRATPYAG